MFNKNHHRRSIRLHHYNYAQNGMYYVTLCIQHHQCMLGEIKNNVMINNDAGNMINKWLQKIPEKFCDIILDEYIVMPNHLHAILINTGSVGADGPGNPVGSVIQWVKTMSTNEYIRNVKSNGWPAFDRKLWQRNYYEHIIRDNESYQRIKQYIIDNPLKWNKKSGSK